MKRITIRKLKYEDAKRLFLQEIEKLFLAGETDVEVLHGVGMYKLKEMVLEEVKKSDYLEIVEFDFQLNPGTTRIRILSPSKQLLSKYLI